MEVHEKSLRMSLALTCGKNKSLVLIMKFTSLALALVMNAKFLVLALNSEIYPC